MRYSLALIEDQIISTLQANNNLQGVNIRTHAGDLNPNTFFNEQALEGLTMLTPFIFVQYIGRRGQIHDATWETRSHDVKFRFYVGAQTLRDKRETQLNCYDMLSNLYDSIHGKYPKSLQVLANTLPLMDGDTIQTSFTALSPMKEVDGDNERLLVNLPSIAVYVTDYYLEILA